MEKEFKKRQIEIYDAEIILANDTQVLLFDMLKSLTDEEKLMLADYEIDDSKTISSIGEDCRHVVVFDELDDEPELINLYLDDMTQIEQKNLIDYIMEIVFSN